MTGGVYLQGSGLPGSSFLEVAQSACGQLQGGGLWKMGLERGHDFFCFKPHGAVFSPERPTLQTLCCWGCPELSQVEEEGGSEWLSAVGAPACLLGGRGCLVTWRWGCW